MEVRFWIESVAVPGPMDWGKGCLAADQSHKYPPLLSGCASSYLCSLSFLPLLCLPEPSHPPGGRWGRWVGGQWGTWWLLQGWHGPKRGQFENDHPLGVMASAICTGCRKGNMSHSGGHPLSELTAVLPSSDLVCFPVYHTLLRRLPPLWMDESCPGLCCNY